MPQVLFDTRLTTLLRIDATLGELHCPEAFPEITRVEGDGQVFELPGYSDEDATARHELPMSDEALTKLGGYLLSRYLTEKPPSGNCHDFTSYMAGHDAGRLDATRHINSLLPLAVKLDDSDPDFLEPVTSEDILLVAHPGYSMIGPPDKYLNSLGDYTGPGGHGSLQVCHSLLGSSGLQRMAFGGPLGLLDPITTLRNHRVIMPESTDPSHWENEIRPQPEDINLYRVTRDALLRLKLANCSTTS